METTKKEAKKGTAKGTKKAAVKKVAADKKAPKKRAPKKVAEKVVKAEEKKPFELDLSLLAINYHHFAAAKKLARELNAEAEKLYDADEIDEAMALDKKLTDLQAFIDEAAPAWEDDEDEPAPIVKKAAMAVVKKPAAEKKPVVTDPVEKAIADGLADNLFPAGQTVEYLNSKYEPVDGIVVKTTPAYVFINPVAEKPEVVVRAAYKFVTRQTMTVDEAFDELFA